MHTLLTPVLGLIVWTLIIWLWMYVTRIPAMQKAGIDPATAKHPGSLDGLPSTARAVADNYNHLMEQPTIFYAMVFYIVLAGHTDQLHIWLAWAYVALRVVHSLVQNTINAVPIRFGVFALSTLVLAGMAIREVIAFL